MYDYLLHYRPVPPTTWAYLSSLLTIAVYFKFSRLWSVRNLDLIALVALAPGLLLVQFAANPSETGGDWLQQLGYIWIFSANGFFLIRLLLDPTLVRRPLLEPNLSVGGLTFVGASLFCFLMANVLNSELTEARKLTEAVLTRQDVAQDKDSGQDSEQDLEQDSLARHGPGYPLLMSLPHIVTQKIINERVADATGSDGAEVASGDDGYVTTARTMAILSHLVIVFGLVIVGYRHFDNITTGIAAATLYLLLPCTAQLTGRVDHVLPAGLLIWAVVTYRRPFLAGLFVGLTIGVNYYAAFLLPLWLSFYWQRGCLRFTVGVIATVAVLVGMLAYASSDATMFWAQLRQMFGWRRPIMNNLGGMWQFVNPAYRIPVLALFVALCGSLAIWPAQKNLGTLISCSAAVMLATQFWHAHGGGLYVAWYLPLLLLAIFRPNLEDRVALSVLGEGWLPRRGRMVQAA